MMICNNCGKQFEEDEVGHYEEKDQFWGFPCTQRFSCCPYCGDDDIEDIE